jgi:hypothetical protein
MILCDSFRGLRAILTPPMPDSSIGQVQGKVTVRVHVESGSLFGIEGVDGAIQGLA